MMKWGFALNAALGSLLVASAIGVPGGSQDLELSLDRAARGLEELAGLRTRLERGDSAAISDVLKRSETPGANTRADEERLALLRFEVSRLQMDWDALAGLVQDASPRGKPGGERVPTTATDKAAPAAGLTAFEAPGFSADPVRQGEALFRAEKYAESLSVLRTAPDDARAQYWSARALERLGKPDEAIALYRTISERKDAGWAAERARADLEFLTWKQSAAEIKKP